jgi:pimeloyl-ACP methyl ester carboxylesterase
MTDPAMTRFAHRLNSRLAYDPGDRTDPARPVVVLLHGMLGERFTFAEAVAGLAPVARVVTPDARGHGISATLANQWYSVGELAQDLQAVLDQEDLARVHLVGHDIGAVTALDLALREPHRVASLTLIDPTFGAALDNDPDPATRALRTQVRDRDRAAADAAYKGLTAKALDGYLGRRWGVEWRGLLPKPRQGMIMRNAAALTGLLPALDSYTPGRADLRALPVPATILRSANAPVWESAIAARLAEWLPAGSLSEMPALPGPGLPLTGEVAESLVAAVTARVTAG